MNNCLTKLKRKESIYYIGAFLLGFFIVLIPCLIVLHNGKEDRKPSPTPSSWNESDYQSNSDFYKNIPEHSVKFSQLDNLRLDRLSSGRFNPVDGSSIIYLRKQYHMPDCNGSTTTLHWIKTDIENKMSIQLTRPIWGIHDQQFYWIDSKTILFLSNRSPSGLTQIFQLNLPSDVSKVTQFIEPIQITDYPLNLDNLIVNQQGTRLAFSCQVYVNFSIEETANRQLSEKMNEYSAYKFDKLFIRHWDTYMIGPRNHPFVVSIKQDSNGIFQLTSEIRDVLFDKDSDSPTRPFGDAKSQWSFSASGNSFAFTRQHDETSEVAWSTNLDIYTIDLNQADSFPICISCENLAADTDPKYSPIEENVLVYRSQSVPGYESDQYKIKLYNGTFSKRILVNTWDRSILGTTWSKDGQSLFLELGEMGRNRLYRLSKLDTNEEIELIYADGTSHDVNYHPNDNNLILLTNSHFKSPTNICLFKLNDKSLNKLTNHNENLLKSVILGRSYEEFSFLGANNEIVYGWHVFPPMNVPGKSPLVFLIHGGPQNSWYDTWGYGWNFQVYASQGYAVIAINFHGSDSYGQNFTDSITGQYGTLPFEDLQLGLTAVLNNNSYIDENRAVALGASFGGFMINWIAGHPQMSQRFRALVCHDGLFDMREMGYATEELWFSEHDAGGFTPYQNPMAYEQFNPVNHVANWTQPMLIIHGGRDYRVPDTQGIAAFTALQRRNIPSRLLYFPNENHWILNQLNSIVWFDEVFQWIHKWTD